MHPAIDLIHDTHHLCTRSRTDGIKAMSRGFSGGRQKKNIAKGRNRSGIYCSRQQETKTFFHLKDDIMSPNGKLARRLNLIAPKKAKHRKRRKTRI